MPGGVCDFTLSGKSGSAMNFDGINDYVNISHTARFNLTTTTNMTIEAWVNPKNVCSDPLACIIVSKHSPIGIGEYSFYFKLASGTNEFQYVFHNESLDEGYTTSSVNISVGVWTHMAGSYNGTTMNAYVNGVLIDNVSRTGRPIDSNESVFIGIIYSPNIFYYPYNGSIDDVKIWNRTLSGVEINLSMNGQEMNESGLVLWQRFDEGKGLLACSDFASVRVTTQCADAQDVYTATPRC